MVDEQEIKQLLDEINDLKKSVKEDLNLLEEKTERLESLVVKSNKTELNKENNDKKESEKTKNTSIDEKTRRDIMSSLLEKYSN